MGVKVDLRNGKDKKLKQTKKLYPELEEINDNREDKDWMESWTQLVWEEDDPMETQTLEKLQSEEQRKG